eukprot:scaffold993_cov110-Cylindrotheca_fusiformis.AAC.19
MAKLFGNPIQTRKPNTSENGHGDSEPPAPSLLDPLTNFTASVVIPQFTRLALKGVLGATLVLYVLNQQHMLPRPLSAVVSQALFWPTLPITVSRRIGEWVTRVDDTVLIGGAPFGFLNYPEKLYEQHGVRGVINMCEEYRGPLRKYKDLGIEELYLPTTDHFEPSLEDLMSAVAFIRRHQAQGKCVYVHCRAGHGRSAAAVFGWLVFKDPIVDLEALNRDFRKLRNVRSTLWKQPNMKQFHTRLLTKGTLFDTDDIVATNESTPRLVQDVSDRDSDEDEF